MRKDGNRNRRAASSLELLSSRVAIKPIGLAKAEINLLATNASRGLPFGLLGFSFLTRTDFIHRLLKSEVTMKGLYEV